jgi:hypothetical protein
MNSERDGHQPRSQAKRKPVASNARLSADGGCIFADASNAGTSAAVILRQVSMHRSITRVRSFEPGERWFYDYRGEFFAGPQLHAPRSHPLDQWVPGPAEAVPSNWQTLLHE